MALICIGQNSPTTSAQSNEIIKTNRKNNQNNVTAITTRKNPLHREYV